jgi:tRNA (cytidine/uridine-2'-O-)-methyltransferase
MRIVLYQPDIAANFGAMQRLGACFGVPLDVVEPCGFPLDDRRLRRAAMDYHARSELRRHVSWADFQAAPRDGRLILLTTAGDTVFPGLRFAPNDCLMLGRETSGVPQEVHAAADLRLRIPLASGLRSLNVVAAAAMVLGEALRQTDGFPGTGREHERD